MRLSYNGGAPRCEAVGASHAGLAGYPLLSGTRRRRGNCRSRSWPFAWHNGGLQIAWAASCPCAAPARLRTCLSAHDGLEFHGCRHLGFPYPLWSPASLLRLCRAVAQCDVVHLHDCVYMGNVAAAVRARALGKPILVTQHVGQVPYRLAVLRRAAGSGQPDPRARCALAATDRFHQPAGVGVLSPGGSFCAEPLWIPNGLARETFSPVAGAERAELRRDWAGRTTGRCCCLWAASWRRRGSANCAAWPGGFPNAAGCSSAGDATTRRWQLANVQSAGRVAHDLLPRYYRAADLLVLPSVGEGFPLVVQEAMACGTPVLISAETARGSPGVEQAALVSAAEEDALVVAVGRFLECPAEADTLRGRVADYARQHWDWERCVARYAALLAEAGGASPVNPDYSP